MKILKKNQIILFVIAFMLVSAGYLNYTSLHGENSIATSTETNTILEMAGIGDAKLVSSNGIVETNTTIEETNTMIENKEVENTISNIVKEEISTNSNKITESSQYFSSSKISRDTMYSQMIESYQKILESENIDATQKGIAQTEIQTINQTKNAIMITENLIKTKGFEDVVIFVNDMSVSVIIKTKELTKEQIAQIQNIVTRELKADIQNVHISNKE